MLDTRGDDHHAPADARRAQADEKEKEKLAHRVHAQILAVVYCTVHGGGKRRRVSNRCKSNRNSQSEQFASWQRAGCNCYNRIQER